MFTAGFLRTTTALLIGIAGLGLAGCESDSPAETKAKVSMGPNAPANMAQNNAQPGLQPARGLNTQKLFATPENDDDKRFERVENAVQNISDEMNIISPSVIRLMQFESDMQTLLTQLREQREAEAAAIVQEPLAQDAPVPLNKASTQKPEKPKAAASAAPITTGEGLRVVRLADSAGKTRLVFETQSKMSYKLDLDNKEKILIVDFTSGKNSVKTDSLKLRSKLIKGLTESAKGGEGFILAFPLAKETKVLSQGEIPPGKESPNYRYYIDLKL